MAEQRPTDQFCKPHEYLVEGRDGTWLICDVRGRLRVHPEEYPPEFRTAPIQGKESWVETLAMVPLWVLFVFTFPISWLVWLAYEHLSGGHRRHQDWERLQEARSNWLAAKERDAGVYRPQVVAWADDGFNSWGSPSATKGR